MKKIFISYKRVDRDKVFAIKDRIEAATGLECWIDLEGIESDAVFENVIIRAINNCEVFLFMYSQHHTQITNLEEDWTIRELSFASLKKKRIVFVNIDGSELSDIFSFRYVTKQQVDARSDEAIARLCKDIRQWLKCPTPPPAAPEPETQPKEPLPADEPKMKWTPMTRIIVAAAVATIVLIAAMVGVGHRQKAHNPSACSAAVATALRKGNVDQASSLLTDFAADKALIYSDYQKVVGACIDDGDLDGAKALCRDFGRSHNREYVLQPLYNRLVELGLYDEAYAYLPFPNSYATDFGRTPTDDDIIGHMTVCVRTMCDKGQRQQAREWVQQQLTVLFAGRDASAQYLSTVKNDLNKIINTY